MSEVMPVDVWPRAAEALELWTENGLTVEFLEGMSYNHRVALMAAARWGLEAQQRGERIDWCEKHSAEGIPRLGVASDRCWKGEFIRHLNPSNCEMVKPLLVPLEGEQ